MNPQSATRIASFELSSAARGQDRFRIAMVVPPYFDVPPAAYGGVEAVVADLVDALIDRGHEVTLLGAGEPGTKARFVPVWDRIQADRLGEVFPEVMHALKTRRALERIVAHEGIDLVHDHTFAGPLNAPFYRELGLPTVVTVHGPVGGEEYMYYSELGREVSLVAISDRQRALAPGLNWAGRVHNALRVEDWPLQSHKSDYALFLGRFTEDKAPHLALRAAHAAGMPLVLAGKCKEPAEKTYFDRAVRPLLTERDHVFGMADSVAKKKLLAQAQCLLFPVQWEEPFGMLMIEAMVCGTPVVALRGGAVSEVIVDGVTGRICDDPAELPAAMAEVRDYDPAACRAHVIRNFGADTLGRGYEQVYRRVLRSERSRTGHAAPVGALSVTGALTPGTQTSGTVTAAPTGTLTTASTAGPLTTAGPLAAPGPRTRTGTLTTATDGPLATTGGPLAAKAGPLPALGDSPSTTIAPRTATRRPASNPARGVSTHRRAIPPGTGDTA